MQGLAGTCGGSSPPLRTNGVVGRSLVLGLQRLHQLSLESCVIRADPLLGKAGDPRLKTLALLAVCP